MKETFETSDTGLASFLMARGFRVIGTNAGNDGRVSFRFAADDNNIEGSVAAFVSGKNDSVSGAKYADSERKLRQMIRNIKR